MAREKKPTVLVRENGRKSLLERVAEKFTEAPCPRPDVEGPCWVWTMGCKTHDGYARIKNADQMCLAHRVAWELVHGDIPEGMKCLHRCDQRHCINPAHLFLGTDGVNAADRDAKNRQAKGDTHGAVMRAVQQNRGGTSSFPGVHRHQGKWRAQVRIDGRKLHLGCHSDEALAAQRYQDVIAALTSLQAEATRTSGEALNETLVATVSPEEMDWGVDLGQE